MYIVHSAAVHYVIGIQYTCTCKQCKQKKSEKNWCCTLLDILNRFNCTNLNYIIIILYDLTDTNKYYVRNYLFIPFIAGIL